MKNEYGAKLDANGYAQSIVQDEADESVFSVFQTAVTIRLTVMKFSEAPSGRNPNG